MNLTELLTAINDAVFGAICLNFIINILFLLFLIRIVKSRFNLDSGYLLSIFILNIIIYFTTAVLEKSELNLGAGFGLFAVFSMLRFRTSEISLQQMTFMFLAIAFGLISAAWQTNIINLVVVFLVILGMVYALIKFLMNKGNASKTIFYDKIDLIVPEKEQELIADLSNRTGLNVQKVEILSIDFLKDASQIKIYYK